MNVFYVCLYDYSLIAEKVSTWDNIGPRLKLAKDDICKTESPNEAEHQVIPKWDELKSSDRFDLLLRRWMRNVKQLLLRQNTKVDTLVNFTFSHTIIR